MFWIVIVGMFLGALFTRLAIFFLPESAARSFLTTSASASLGPLGIDLVAFSFVLGPLTFTVNTLTLFGILLVALIMRSWL
jgi:hypothetical protein